MAENTGLGCILPMDALDGGQRPEGAFWSTVIAELLCSERVKQGAALQRPSSQLT